MYTKEEASKRRQAFWTTFGQYMSPVLSASGLKTNWINYKTGEPNIFFKMDADNRSARIALLLTHPDTGIQELYYEQLLELKNMLHGVQNEEWDWNPLTKDDAGKTVSMVSKTITGVNVLQEQDWPALISFFKPRIIALDEFWDMVKHGFEALR